MSTAWLTAGWLSLALFALGVLHLYWGLGGKRYRAFAIPHIDGRPTVAPSGAAYITVAAGLWAAGLLALSRVLRFPGWGLHGAEATWLWIVAGLFAVRAVGDFRLIGFFCRRVDAPNRAFERRFAAPLSALLAIGFARMALLPAAT